MQNSFIRNSNRCNLKVAINFFFARRPKSEACCSVLPLVAGSSIATTLKSEMIDLNIYSGIFISIFSPHLLSIMLYCILELWCFTFLLYNCDFVRIYTMWWHLRFSNQGDICSFCCSSLRESHNFSFWADLTGLHCLSVYLYTKKQWKKQSQ